MPTDRPTEPLALETYAAMRQRRPRLDARRRSARPISPDPGLPPPDFEFA
ncbi:MAG: hypothetical protein JNJ48_07420 [Phycisphaerae bacterium]|nr:hypothetical protein [Phycisphaerae bacterium]